MVGVTSCVLGDTLKEKDEDYLKKMVELEFIKLEFYVEYFPCQMPLVGSPLGSRVLKTRDASFPVCFANWQLMIFLEN